MHEAFRQGPRDLGYVEGRNLVIEYRDAEGKFERLPDLAAELVALKVDVIVADTLCRPRHASLGKRQPRRPEPIQLEGRLGQRETSYDTISLTNSQRSCCAPITQKAGPWRAGLVMATALSARA